MAKPLAKGWGRSARNAAKGPSTATGQWKNESTFPARQAARKAEERRGNFKTARKWAKRALTGGVLATLGVAGVDSARIIHMEKVTTPAIKIEAQKQGVDLNAIDRRRDEIFREHGVEYRPEGTKWNLNTAKGFHLAPSVEKQLLKEIKSGRFKPIPKVDGVQFELNNSAPKANKPPKAGPKSTTPNKATPKKVTPSKQPATNAVKYAATRSARATHLPRRAIRRRA